MGAKRRTRPLHNLSWACEKAGRVIEAKDYASRYLTQSRGTEDEAMAERRVKFLSGRYPDAGTTPSTTALKPSQPPRPRQTADNSTSRFGSCRQPQAIHQTQTSGDRTSGGGGAALAVSAGLAGGAIGAWAEAASPDTYFDRWQSLNSRGQALSIASGVLRGRSGADCAGSGSGQTAPSDPSLSVLSCGQLLAEHRSPRGRAFEPLNTEPAFLPDMSLPWGSGR